MVHFFSDPPEGGLREANRNYFRERIRERIFKSDRANPAIIKEKIIHRFAASIQY